MTGSTQQRLQRAASGQAEHELIGSLVLDRNGSAIEEVGRLISPQQLANERLKTAYRIILRRHNEGLATNADAIATELSHRKDVIVELTRALDLVSHSLNADFYARQVCEDFKRRSFHSVVSTTNEALARVDSSVDEALSLHLSQIETLLDNGATESDGHIAEHLLTIGNDEPDARYTTGMQDLDVLLNDGFASGQLAHIGARPSVGKTALCTGFALAAAKAETPTLFLPFEMSGSESTERIRRQFRADGPDDHARLNQLERVSEEGSAIEAGRVM